MFYGRWHLDLQRKRSEEETISKHAQLLQSLINSRQLMNLERHGGYREFRNVSPECGPGLVKLHSGTTQ